MSMSDFDFTDDDHIETVGEGTVVRRCGSRSLRLCDHFGARAQGDNPLYEVEIEVPDESYLEFDSKGMMIAHDQSNEMEIIYAARNCINLIHSENMYMDGEQKEGDFDKQFSIVDGKLVRNYFI